MERILLNSPEQELRLGEIAAGETYWVTVVPRGRDTSGNHKEPAPGLDLEGAVSSPPVREGEIREVEIEDIGDQGDSITRVERGYVVIVPETEQGERVTIEITTVRENIAFAEVVERQSHVS